MGSFVNKPYDNSCFCTNVRYFTARGHPCRVCLESYCSQASRDIAKSLFLNYS